MYTLNCRGKILCIDQPIVMGILNITPDSFFEGHLHQPLEDIVGKVAGMLTDGAAIIDVGGQSTKPGSGQIDAAEEAARVLPVIVALVKRFPGINISIDTFYSEVASAAVKAGAMLVNDVSGGQLDEKMFSTVGELNVPYVCTHLRGTPATMHTLTQYDDLLHNVIEYFAGRVFACRQAGIKDIIIDPGFGFAKNTAQNLYLLHHLTQFKLIDLPILAGLSRKKTIWQTLDITPSEALNGTTVLNTIALQNGADLLRVHDVKEAVQAIKLQQAYLQAANKT